MISAPSFRPAACAHACLAATLMATCAPIATSGPGCAPLGPAVALPDELVESSGVAFSRTLPGILWSHDDGTEDVVFAIDSTGAVRARFQLSLATRDFEDLAVAACGDDTCLYLSDMGDNYEERAPGSTRILRVREPLTLASDTLEAEAFPVRLPDGARDVEALLVMPGERLFAVTKGRNHAVSVYRYPPPLRPDTVTLEEVQRLSDGARFLPRQVTGGAVSPDGGVVALRTYESVQFYTMEADTLVPLDDGLVNLRTLEEAQGEGVAIGPGGRVALTSEGGPTGGPAGLVLMRCRLPGA